MSEFRMGNRDLQRLANIGHAASDDRHRAGLVCIKLEGRDDHSRKEVTHYTV